MNPAKFLRSGPIRPVAQYVAFHARRRPRQPAILGAGRLIPYAALNGHLQSMTHALRALGLDRGAQVAVGHSDLYVHLLIVFGFESLGIVTGSFRPDEGADCHPLLAGADLTISQKAPPAGVCRRFFAITDAWVEAALACPVSNDAPANPPLSADDGMMIRRSSGTSGRPKRMLATHGMMRMRETQWAAYFGLNAESRFLAAMHFSMATMQSTASACLRLGAAIMFDFRHPLTSVLATYRPTHLILMPFQLSLLLDGLPNTGAPLLPNLVLSTVGGKFTPTLRGRVRERLCDHILEGYGSNEVGMHSIVDDTGVGTVVPGVEVDVVDSQGRSLPEGEIGQVRLRGDGVVRGYLDDAAATAEMFHDGWFQPGDLAMFVSPGRLKLVGRRTDVMNIGGRKIACADVESDILGQAPVREVAVLQGDDPRVDEFVMVCVVIDAHVDPVTLTDAIRPIMKTKFAVAVVDTIPRTPEGKIKRGALQELLAGRPKVTQPAGQPPTALRQTVNA